MNTNIYYLRTTDAVTLRKYLTTCCDYFLACSDQDVFFVESRVHKNYSVVVEHKELPQSPRIPVHLIRFGQEQHDLFEGTGLDDIIDDLLKKKEEWLKRVNEKKKEGVSV